MSWRKEGGEKLKPLVEKALHKKKVLGAICDASVFLGKIGVLNNIKHTSNDINDLKKLYAILLENTIFPLNINNCLLVAIKYYIKKYGICTLCDKNNNVILYYK